MYNLPYMVGTRKIVYVTFLYLLMVPIVAVNLLTVIAVTKFKGEKLTPTDVLIFGLALSDFVAGILAIPLDSCIFFSQEMHAIGLFAWLEMWP